MIVVEYNCSIDFLTQKIYVKHVGVHERWREGMIVYKRTSHSSDIKALKLSRMRRLLFLVDLMLELVLKESKLVHSRSCETFKGVNFFVLDEREVCSYTIIQ